MHVNVCNGLALALAIASVRYVSVRPLSDICSPLRKGQWMSRSFSCAPLWRPPSFYLGIREEKGKHGIREEKGAHIVYEFSFPQHSAEVALRTIEGLGSSRKQKSPSIMTMLNDVQSLQCEILARGPRPPAKIEILLLLQVSEKLSFCSFFLLALLVRSRTGELLVDARSRHDTTFFAYSCQGCREIRDPDCSF